MCRVHSVCVPWTKCVFIACTHSVCARSTRNVCALRTHSVRALRTHGMSCSYCVIWRHCVCVRRVHSVCVPWTQCVLCTHSVCASRTRSVCVCVRARSVCVCVCALRTHSVYVRCEHTVCVWSPGAPAASLICIESHSAYLVNATRLPLRFLETIVLLYCESKSAALKCPRKSFFSDSKSAALKLPGKCCTFGAQVGSAEAAWLPKNTPTI